MIKDLCKVAKICKKKKYKLYISNNLKLAIKFKADGFYIPAFNKTTMNHLNYIKKNMLILGSAHSQKEIYEKKRQKCSIIFLSPIFKTKKYKKNNQLGTVKFNLISNVNKVNFYALGGINEYNFKKLKNSNAKGFGGVSFFQKKTGLNLGRFF